MKFNLNDEQVTFNVCQSVRQPKDIQVVSVIDTVYEDALVVPNEERLGVEVLATVIINFDSEGIDKYDE